MPEVVGHLNHLGDLSTLPWKEVTRGRPPLNPGLLRSLADDSGDLRGFEAFLVHDDGELCALAVGRLELPGERGTPLDRWLFGRGRRWARAMGISTGRVLFFRSPMGPGASLVVRPDLPTARAMRLVDLLLNDIEMRARRQGCGIAFSDLTPEADGPLASALQARGYLATHGLPTSELLVEWDDLDGYIAHLAGLSPRAARTVRYELRHNRQSGIEIRQLPTELKYAQMLDRWSRNHYQRKNGIGLPYDANVLARLVAESPEDLLIFEAHRAGERLGMLGVVRCEEVGWAAWIGLLDQEGRGAFTYFNLVFYHLAAHAASLGIRRLLYGTLAYEAKRIRGCEILPGTTYYRPCTRPMRMVSRPFMRFHRAWIRRKLV